MPGSWVLLFRHLRFIEMDLGFWPFGLVTSGRDMSATVFFKANIADRLKACNWR